MSAIYDNWERLVRATIRREELRLSALRTFSDLSLASASPSRSVSSSDFSNLSLIRRSFTYRQILQATNNLSSSNIIKNGRSGVFFHGVLKDGVQVVVQKVDLSSAEKVSFLNSEVRFFDRVSHPNFVPLLGHWLEGWKHNFLVYKYLPNKDLATSLCSAAGHQSMLLDWKKRHKVAIGVAQALCHLHHDCMPPLAHRNVKASSILIDENYDGHLGGIIEVFTNENERKQSRISRLLKLAKGSVRHPSGAWDGTRADDVYCFGQVLLELVTARPVPSNYSIFGDWNSIDDALARITTLDTGLFLFEDVVDRYLLTTGDEGVLNQVWNVALIAKACLSPKPSKRPQMANVLKALQELSMKGFSTYINPGVVYGFTPDGR